jgi:hypothetical protein
MDVEGKGERKVKKKKHDAGWAFDARLYRVS